MIDLGKATLETKQTQITGSQFDNLYQAFRKPPQG